MRTVANPLPVAGRGTSGRFSEGASRALGACYGTLQMPEVKHLAQVYRQVIL